MPLITFPYPVRTRYIFAAHGHGQHSVVPQAVMVVDVFVAQAYPLDTLPEHRLHGMFDSAGIAVIRETGGKAADDVEHAVGLP